MEKSTYRIIDANFNRAREGARVMEEFARFVLNSKPLSARAKQIRHEISGVVSLLGNSNLLAARESTKDVGAGLAVCNQLSRTTIEDTFIAASKRLPEALRVLAETIQTINPEYAAQIEAIRFKAYTLEKDLSFAMNAKSKFANVRLYVLIDAMADDEFEQMLSAVIKGGADCIQLRAKNTDGQTFYRLACKMVAMCKDAGVVSIINDRPDIAVSSGADGVHLGLCDVPAEVVRNISPRPLVLGLTTHNPDELRDAIASGADYVGVGPVAKTQTKPELTPSGMPYVRQAIDILKDTGVYHTMIGGVNHSNIPELTAAGVKSVAVSSAITKSSNPEHATRELKSLL